MYLEDETPFEWCDSDTYTQRTLDFVTEFPVDNFNVWASSPVAKARSLGPQSKLSYDSSWISSHSLSFPSAAGESAND